MSVFGSAVSVLREADRRIEAAVGPRCSLSPEREYARSLAELGELLMVPEIGPDRAAAFAAALARVAESFARDYPENIFWDLDHVAARLLAAGEKPEIDALAGRLILLAERFGIRSEIRFRYLHDFIFGFDWARWVARAPEERAHVGPFDGEFLTYLEQRQAELVELIAQDDQKYGRLEPQIYRNPFLFSREPADERRLHRLLAERGLIPVRAWTLSGEPRWDAPFATLRDELAAELGFARALDL